MDNPGLPRQIIEHPSPNQNDRVGGPPDILLLHFTNMISAEAAVERLCCPVAKVSCHYVIAEDGRVWQLVPEARRAWHAGVGGWGQTTEDMNSRTIGIELANAGHHPFPEPQMRVLETMMPGIMQRWSIRPERVIGHSDMAPDRKDDPGPKFDWRRLALQGLAVWSQATPKGDEDLCTLRTLCVHIGYDARYSDGELLTAVRLRYRPWATGPLNAGDIATLRDIAARFPVDRGRPSA